MSCHEPRKQNLWQLTHLKGPWMLCIVLQPCQKLGMILINKVAKNLKLPKNNFNKKCAPRLLFLIEKNQKDWDDF